MINEIFSSDLATNPVEAKNVIGKNCCQRLVRERAKRASIHFQIRYPHPLMSDVTQILDRVQRGDSQASEELLPAVYEELRKLAAQKMAHEAPGNTLQATALVHEAWLRLEPSLDQRWENRAHFFGAAAEAMRRILVDSARRKKRLKHGGGLKREAAGGGDFALPQAGEEVVGLAEGRDRLGRVGAPAAHAGAVGFFCGV